ncbi:MAG: hypothetical protein HXS46_15730 [Theionarchaea archaeon]|nr:hypothetical protein [Theionarchaea archaeon]
MNVAIYVFFALIAAIGAIIARYLIERTYPPQREEIPFHADIPQDRDLRDLLTEQEKLDVMYHLSKGVSIEEIATKMSKTRSFVQQTDVLLRNYGLLTDTRWGIDTEALKMKKILKVYPHSEGILEKVLSEDAYITHFVQIREGKGALIAIYTFPEEAKKRVSGIPISSWYYSFPRFTIPFFKENLYEEFFGRCNSVSNENPFLPRGTHIKDVDLIHIFICRYAQLWPELTVDNLTTTIKEEIGDLTRVSSDLIKERLETLIKSNVIFPINPLFFGRINYNSLISIIEHREIYRILKAFNQFNIIAAMCYISKTKYGLWLHYFHRQEKSILDILDDLDSHSQTYLLSDTLIRRTIPYDYYLNKERGIPHEED